MTENTKKTLIYAGAIVIGSVIAYSIYKSRKNDLNLVNIEKLNAEDGKTTPEGTKSTKSNPFTQYVNNPLPSSIGWKPENFGYNPNIDWNKFAYTNTGIK